MTNTKTTKHETLASALAAFQADLPEIKLDSTNPHFRSKFASLANITKVVLPRLAEHGLSFSVGAFVEGNVMIVDAHLIHESGSSRNLQFPITDTNPQKIGSALSYARRYALSSLTGVVADEDDDGNAASNPSAVERQLDAARGGTQKATATVDLNVLKAAVRAYIDGAEDPEKTRGEVVAVQDKLKKSSGKTGLELQKLVNAELGI